MDRVLVLQPMLMLELQAQGLDQQAVQRATAAKVVQQQLPAQPLAGPAIRLEQGLSLDSKVLAPQGVEPVHRL